MATDSFNRKENEIHCCFIMMIFSGSVTQQLLVFRQVGLHCFGGVLFLIGFQ